MHFVSHNVYGCSADKIAQRALATCIAEDFNASMSSIRQPLHLVLSSSRIPHARRRRRLNLLPSTPISIVRERPLITAYKYTCSACIASHRASTVVVIEEEGIDHGDEEGFPACVRYPACRCFRRRLGRRNNS
jgi:hypothetical protein